MKARESYAKTTTLLEGKGRGALKATIAEKKLPPKLGIFGKGGIWIWILLLGADVVYELAAFADGADGNLTLSQVIKRARRAGGITGSIALVIALAILYVALNLHLVSEVF